MADSSRVAHCDRLEAVAVLPMSKRKALLDVTEKNVGWLTIHVEGHEYMAVRQVDKGHSEIRVTRMDLEQEGTKRFFQVMAEFFTHRVLDFFRLRGVGSRADRIAGMIEDWMRLPDGQGEIRGVKTFMAPAITSQIGPHKETVSVDDYVDNHLAIHCQKEVDSVKLSRSVAPLSARDRAWLKEIVQRLFPDAKACSADGRAAILDEASCIAAARASFQPDDGDKDVDELVLEHLMAELTGIASNPPEHADNATLPPAVFQARLLLLARALSASRRTPAQAHALLERLQTPGALHDLTDDSPEARECWEAARLLAGSEFGFRLLCELVQPPTNLCAEVEAQWRAALKIYLSASDHLIADGKTRVRKRLEENWATVERRFTDMQQRLKQVREDGQAHGPAWQSAKAEAERLKLERERIKTLFTELVDIELRATVQPWARSPVSASAHAATCIDATASKQSNLMPHRTLRAAVKLLGLRELVDATWLEGQYRDGADRAAPSDDTLNPVDVMALATWRNGFRDDREDTALAEFAKRLDSMLTDLLPRDVVDKDTGEKRAVWNSGSPFRAAFESPLARTVTRRPVTEQVKDFHANVGSLGRLLILELKSRHALPLRPDEEVMLQTLQLLDAVRNEMPEGEKKDDFVRRLDELATLIEEAAVEADLMRNGRYEVAPEVRGRCRHQTTPVQRVPPLVRIRLNCINQELQSEWHLATRTHCKTMSSAGRIRDALRASLLERWLACTELGARWQPYKVTGNVRNTVIADLSDLLNVRVHQKTIDEELKQVPDIDFVRLAMWSVNSGLGGNGLEDLSCVNGELHRRMVHHWSAIDALARGFDKVDAGRLTMEKPRCRQDYQKLISHLINVNLGSGVLGEVSRSRGIQVSFSVDAGCDLMLPSAPSVSISGSSVSTVIARGGIVSSSVGGAAIQISEELRAQTSAEIGIKGKINGVASAGVDGGYGAVESKERGIALRFPPTPGSRDWVKVAQATMEILFGEATMSAEADEGQIAPNTTADAISSWRSHLQGVCELCWQLFPHLLTGKLALNLLTAARAVDSGKVGASASIGVQGPVESLTLSVSLRFGGEYDAAVRQYRIDATGSTRLEVHSIGIGSRQTAGVRFLLNLLPRQLTDHLHTALSMGQFAGISATFMERGVQHNIRRETRDGMAQGTLAWDIVYRNVEDQIAHMREATLQDHWRAYRALKPQDPYAELETALKTIRAHASHSNQSYLVRRQLKPDRMAELNALTALLQGLPRGGRGASGLTDRDAFASRCLTLLQEPENYEFCGIGMYSNDRRDWLDGVDGVVIATHGEAVIVSTEMLWFPARITKELRTQAAQDFKNEGGPPTPEDSMSGRRLTSATTHPPPFHRLSSGKRHSDATRAALTYE